MTKFKSYPVGQGNHDNIHYLLKTDYFTFKLCAFPDINKIFIMSSSTKIDKKIIDKAYVREAMSIELLKWGLTLVAASSELFDLRFDNTNDLMKSTYYKQQLEQTLN